MAKKSTKPKRGPVKDLWCETIETVSVDKDWTTGLDLEETGEGWSAWQAETCDKCGEHVIVRIGHGDARHCDLESDSECEGTVPDFEGPMMNYYYPAEIDDPGDAARKLADTCLCVVEVDGRTGLALTGGGMDLSWEIVGAFVALGMLPPVHFADLPRMADRRTATVDTLTAIAACQRSCEVMAGWIDRRAKSLADLLGELRPEAVEA